MADLERCVAESMLSRRAFLAASANETLLHVLSQTHRADKGGPYTLRETFGALFLGECHLKHFKQRFQASQSVL